MEAIKKGVQVVRNLFFTERSKRKTYDTFEKATNDCRCTTQLIDEDGKFNAAGLDNFIKQVKLVECRLSYAIVSVMGPQSSGKSTLLNHLFDTKFREMDAERGRSQTTRGIWIAKCPNIAPHTIVVDLEGNDSKERGEDDTTFEKQSALFAIAVSDIVLINIWCHDIGREQASNKPLLRIVFQVMLQLCPPRKTTLMFVIRDQTKKTHPATLAKQLMDEVKKIWDSVPKAEARKHSQLSEYFNVQVVSLANYEENREKFDKEVADLRQKFSQSIARGGLAGDRKGVILASNFSCHAQEMWKVIKENKQLDLPSLKVLVATVRCEEIAREKFSSFAHKKRKIEGALSRLVERHLKEGNGNTWPAIRSLRDEETEKVVIQYSSALSGFKLDEEENQRKFSELKSYARGVIVKITKEVAKEVESLMMQRFESMFVNSGGKKKQDILDIAENAQLASLTLLSVLAAIGLDGDYHIALYKTLISMAKSEHLNSTWEEVSATNTIIIITPDKCKSIWDQFLCETDEKINNDISAQKSRKWAARADKAILILKTVAEVGITVTAVASSVVVISASHGIAAGVAGTKAVSAVVVGVANIGTHLFTAAKAKFTQN